jgi:GT2 family glycosyltransferase
MRLLLGVPSGEKPVPEFVTSLAALRLPAACTAFDSLTATGNFVPGQRELIVRRALDLRADFVAMLDDDMVFAPDVLERLHETLSARPSCAVAGALYYSRDGLRPMAVAGWTAANTTSGWVPAFDAGPAEVDGVGFGCVMLRLAALRALVPPYFSAQIYVEQSAARVRLCNEDYVLCERLRQAGFSIVLAAGVRCGHFDRSTGRTLPPEWEPENATNRRRMMVVEPGPRYRLTDYDESVACSTERHEQIPLDYLFVE